MIGLPDSQLRKANQQLTEQPPQLQPPVHELPATPPLPIPTPRDSAITHAHPAPAPYDRRNESQDRAHGVQLQIPGSPPHRATLQADGPQNTPPRKLHTRQHAPAPTEVKPPNIRVKSHNLNKQSAESFIHADMHEEWDICLYQELTRVPSLPFGWNPGKLRPKVFSSVLPSRDEGACIVISARLSPYVFDIPSPSPGALCTALLKLLHLPGLPPVLLVSVYAQPPRRPELEKSLNGLFAKYPMYLVGGDFNAQLSSLDTNRTTDNRWRWLSSLIDKTEAVDTFRAKHPGARAYTRYRSALLNCDTRIDFILCSNQLLSTPSLRLLQASIHDHDRTSDHHPISCVIRPPNTPSYPPPPTRHAHFRRLTQEEQIDFLSHIEPLERWAATLDLTQVPDAQFCSYLDSLVEQIAVAFHRTTNPMKPHKETRLERE